MEHLFLIVINYNPIVSSLRKSTVGRLTLFDIEKKKLFPNGMTDSPTKTHVTLYTLVSAAGGARVHFFLPRKCVWSQRLSGQK